MRSVRRFPVQSAIAFVLSGAVAGCAGHTGSSAIPMGMQAQVRSTGPLSPVASAQRIATLAKRGLGAAADRAGGAGYPVTADPPVAHPPEAPCVDKLFNPHTPPLNPSGLPVGDFADYSDHPFNYSPPTNCPGPYATIVFKMPRASRPMRSSLLALLSFAAASR